MNAKIAVFGTAHQFHLLRELLNHDSRLLHVRDGRHLSGVEIETVLVLSHRDINYPYDLIDAALELQKRAKR